MQRLVITTVGTSLLTNQIDRESEGSYYERLIDTANYSDEEIIQYDDVIDIMEELKNRAENKLKGSLDDIRKACAELNGIYGLYNNQLDKTIPDHHLLIHTDTAQGRDCAIILEKFLKAKGIINIESLYSENFSTASNENFLMGISQLIPILKKKITQDYKGYRICFNLVGGFKAMQGYFNTIGMLYADEIIYIFEDSNNLITIPRLPVEINTEKVKPFQVPLAMMEQGHIPISWEKAKNLPDEWVIKNAQKIILSTWGQLIWSQCKDEFLSQNELLKFPKIEYTQTFEDDYKSKPGHERIELQENLARAAFLLLNNRDGITAMKQDGIFQLRRYTGKNKDIDHFNLPKGRRVSCIANGNNLQLRHYGEHNDVNNNP
jgi:putative CRISPR-associated protein (TIGR02619 family)